MRLVDRLLGGRIRSRVVQRFSYPARKSSRSIRDKLAYSTVLSYPPATLAQATRVYVMSGIIGHRRHVDEPLYIAALLNSGKQVDPYQNWRDLNHPKY